MSGVLQRLLVAYDIVDDSRRTRLAKLLESYGDRVQYSVFIVDVTAAQETRLRRAILDVISAGMDSVLICRLGIVDGSAGSRLTFLGCRRRMTDDTGFVL